MALSHLLDTTPPRSRSPPLQMPPPGRRRSGHLRPPRACSSDQSRVSARAPNAKRTISMAGPTCSCRSGYMLTCALDIICGSLLRGLTQIKMRARSSHPDAIDRPPRTAFGGSEDSAGFGVPEKADWRWRSANVSRRHCKTHGGLWEKSAKISDRVVLNLGTQATIPGIPGLAATPLTNVEALELDRLRDPPDRARRRLCRPGDGASLSPVRQPGEHHRGLDLNSPAGKIRRFRRRGCNPGDAALRRHRGESRSQNFSCPGPVPKNRQPSDA